MCVRIHSTLTVAVLQVQVSQAKQPRVDDSQGREVRGQVSVEVLHPVGLGVAGPPSPLTPDP